MQLTKQNLAKERTRAIKEKTPMVIQECRECCQILPTKFFTKTGRKNHICRHCSSELLVTLKEQGLLDKGATSSYYHNLKSIAKKKGIETNLSLTAFRAWFEREVEDGSCFYCKQTLDRSKENNLQGVTIDRVDNTKGYEVGNMVLACRRCNIIKGSWFSFEDMLSIAEEYLKPRRSTKK